MDKLTRRRWRGQQADLLRYQYAARPATAGVGGFQAARGPVTVVDERAKHWPDLCAKARRPRARMAESKDAVTCRACMAVIAGWSENKENE